MRKIPIVIVFVFCVLSSCQTDQLEYVVNQQTKLIESIKAYKFIRDGIAKLVEGGIKEARTNLSNQKMKVISYQPIAFEWKARLAKIEYELETLTERLKEIDEIAQEYFEKLDTVTNSIKDKALRKTEQLHNKKFRQDWSRIYRTGLQSLEDIKKINQKGQDVRKVIINDGLRQENKNSLQALKSIEQEYEAALTTMTDFACQAGKKVSLKNADLSLLCGKKQK